MFAQTQISSVPLPSIASPLSNAVRQDIAFAQMMLDLGRFQQAIKLATSAMPPKNLGINVRSRSQSHIEILNAAAYTWNYLLQKDYFLLSTNPTAEIQIHITHQAYHLGRPVAGTAHWERQGQYLRAVIQISQDDPTAMLQAHLHELGHILGLGDQSTKSGIMSPMDRNAPILTPDHQELNALQWLDNAASEIIQRATAQL